MPKAAKLKKLEQGKKVSPPKDWWDKMRAKVGRQKKYKGFSRTRLDRITAGIWHGYSVATQKRLVKKYG